MNEEHVMALISAVEEKMAAYGIKHPGYEAVRGAAEEALSEPYNFNLDFADLLDEVQTSLDI